MTDVLLPIALAFIWAAVAVSLVLAFVGAGVAHRAESLARKRVTGPSGGWPAVSLVVPAHNEEDVIEGSLRRFLSLGYPRDRLRVIVVDDGSTDRTGEICDRVARRNRRLTVVHVPPGAGGKGKAVALNRALARCEGELVAVYDADTRPRPDALRRLVRAVRGEDCAGAVGRLLKVPRGRSLLNRLCGLEWTTFQWTFQAGRSRLAGVTLLPGTNYVIHTSVLRALGGWDPRALTEDLELSVRLYNAGYRVAFAPDAVAEEHDPVRLAVWMRQRTRWALGNFYVLFRRTPETARSRQPRALVVLWEMTFLYALFLVGLVVSQAIFVGGLLGLAEVPAQGPLLVLWALAFLVFLATIQLAAAIERTDSWRTPLLGTVMYVAYCPLWLVVLVRSAVVHFTHRGKVPWAKTPHIES
jgi:cellulose synthase/poly-beta-1,6-N-acetylglucosamine synthase-like glycosyltransferase